MEAVIPVEAPTVICMAGATPDVWAVCATVSAVAVAVPLSVKVLDVVVAPEIVTAPVPIVTAPVEVLKVPVPPDQSFAAAPEAVTPAPIVISPLKIEVPASMSSAYLFVPT